ncbi:MAG: hypothetical protein ACRD2W_03015 [Acidimicrobiales bacterium]
MEAVLNVVVFLVGAAMVAGTVGSAVRTVILPRGVPAKLASVVFVTIRRAFDLRVKRIKDYEGRDRVFALYGPLALLLLATTWLLIALVGYAAMHWGLGAYPVREAFTLSGSSLLTLGFDRPPDLPKVALSFTEAGVGLFLVALLISYLPSLYSSFSRREAMVTLLEVRAGSPPSGVEMIERYQLIHDLAELDDAWENWEQWFVELEETHTCQPALVFFRSPQPDHSWVTAAGAVLDGAALYLASSPDEHPKADLCLRAGYLAFRRIADFFAIPYDPSPDPDGPITGARDEFDAAYDRLKEAGVPLKDDRDEAWKAFGGWRVNYDAVLVTLAALVMAPYARWSSDRSNRYRVRALRGRRP